MVLTFLPIPVMEAYEHSLPGIRYELSRVVVSMISDEIRESACQERKSHPTYPIEPGTIVHFLRMLTDENLAVRMQYHLLGVVFSMEVEVGT